MKKLLFILLTLGLIIPTGYNASTKKFSNIEVFAVKQKRKYSKKSYNSYSRRTVSVKGYYRKNGTYVSPHTRSVPSRRK